MLKKSVPQFVAEMREMAELFRVEQAELDLLEIKIEELIKQFYIKTATYAVPDWEKEFNLSDGTGMGLDQRKARLLAKLNTRTPATVEMIGNLVKQTMGAGRVRIHEQPEDYMFIIFVEEEYLSGLLDVAKDAVFQARPAHLNYHFIEQLIRDSITRLYAGAVGANIRQSEAKVDISRLYSWFHLSGMGIFMEIKKGSVK